MTDYSRIATALNTHLSDRYNTTLITDDTWWVKVASMLVKAATSPLPWLQAIIDVFDEGHASRSVTLPKIGGEGAVIVYSTAAISDSLGYCVTISHEHEHARVLKTQPDMQVIADYTSSELRANSEARAYVVGAFTRHLLTGQVQTAEEIVTPLSHGYLLAQADVVTARALVLSDVMTMANGQVPPHEVCHEVLGFLQREFPEAIVPAAFKATA
jgi:hypothetical protein